MANILIVSANLKDWVKNSGGKERTANLIEALSNHNITFLSFSWSGEGFEEKISDNIYQIQPAIPNSAIIKYRKFIKKIASVNYDACFELLKDELEPVSKKIKELSKDADLVIVDHMSISPLVPNLDGIPIVYNSHNSEITMAKQLYPEHTNIVSIVEKTEKNIINKSTAITYCSKKDLQELEDHYGKIKQSLYVPNGTNMQKQIDPLSRMKSNNIIFVGSGHPPNIVAARKVISLAKIMPEYEFTIIGNAGNSLTLESRPSNVNILGQVEDDELNKYFSKSFAFINPMESGSGTHLKMMKALSYGIPIITSAMGARGFSEEEIAESMLVAESLQDMKIAIESLGNKKIYTKFSLNGYEHSKKYDWKIIKKDYANFIESILSDHKVIRKDPVKPTQRKKVLVYSIIRNRAEHISRFHTQLKKVVASIPEYEFYLSIYENDSSDGTKSEIFSKDWSFFKGVSIITEDINTEYFGSVKDATRVENLAKARNKAIEAGGFLNDMDYVLMVEGDVVYTVEDAKKVLMFDKLEPDFDIVSSMSLRKNGSHYDWWATRKSAIFNPDKSEIEDDYESKKYGKYYSTSNGICLYRAQPFKEGIRHHWINTVTKKFDCEMVVLCQAFHEKNYKNIYILYTAKAHHI